MRARKADHTQACVREVPYFNIRENGGNMITVADVTQVISTVGFPIASWCALFWYVVKMAKENTEAINNNTIVLTKLLTEIGNSKEEDK